MLEKIAEFGKRFKAPKFPTEASLGTEKTHCVLSGKYDYPVRVIPSYKLDGTWNMSGYGPIGGKLSSCNAAAFRFYGKKQGFQAPICEEVARNLAIGQTQLLRKDSPYGVCLGKEEFRIAFWTEKPSSAENLVTLLFGYKEEEEAKEQLKKERAEFFHRLRNEPDTLWQDCRDMHGHFVALKRNSGRGAVFGYCEATVDEFLKRLIAWDGLRNYVFHKNKLNKRVLLDFIYNRNVPETYPMITYVDPASKTVSHRVGCNFAIAEKAARELKRESCVTQKVTKCVITDLDLAHVANEFRKNIAAIKRTKKFTRIARVLESMWRNDIGSLRDVPFSAAEFHDGYGTQKNCLYKINLNQCTITDQGLVVRSEGERRIAHCLYRLGIEFFYELHTVLTKDNKKWRIPDFTIFLNGQTIYIEYLGCPHDNWEEKEAAYKNTKNCRLIVIDDRDGRSTEAALLALLKKELGF